MTELRNMHFIRKIQGGILNVWNQCHLVKLIGSLWGKQFDIKSVGYPLASATKRRSRYKSAKVYAIGVDYDKARDKFFARITPFGHDKQVKLHYWNTEEEAFQEYKLFKESEIRVLALRYRDKIPDRLFDALIKYEVHPYSPYEDWRFQRGKRCKTELNQ